MNKTDIKNIKEVLKVRKYQPEFQEGGDLSWEQITSKTTEELEKMVESEEARIKQEVSEEIKKLVDEIFAKYSEEDDNMIVLGGAGRGCDNSRHVCEEDDILEQVDFNGFGHRYNKLAYPVGRYWEIPSYKNQYSGWDADKYKGYLELANKIKEKLPDLGLDPIERYWDDDDLADAICECWHGVHAITKDYMIVSFVIRDDGMLCDEDSFDTFYNSILMQL